MSISVMENPASRAALAAAAADADAISGEQQYAREQIVGLFEGHLKGGDSLLMRVPTVTSSSPMRESTISAKHVITEVVGDGQVEVELLAVLERSDCPLVQALRSAIGARWADAVARDVAAARV